MSINPESIEVANRLRLEIPNLPGRQSCPKPITLIHTNDSGHSRIVEELRAQDPEASDGNIKAAMLVGTSGILSYAPFLREQGIDLALFFDRKNFVHQWIDNSKATLTSDSTETPDEYLLRVYNRKNPLFRAVNSIGVYTKAKILEDLDMERDSFGEYHFLKGCKRLGDCSPDSENFERSKQSVSELQFVYMPTDLLDSARMERIGHLLRDLNIEITFANFTNVYEWVNHDSDRYFNNLSTIPMSELATIAFSRKQRAYRWATESYLEVKNPAVGLDDYKKRATSVVDIPERRN